uniref:Uncharacterized protein n=1 Tax=Arundo donax TaxID=35708 RepID=A0A0A9BKV5_ARUDO
MPACQVEYSCIHNSNNRLNKHFLSFLDLHALCIWVPLVHLVSRINLKFGNVFTCHIGKCAPVD